MRLTGNFFAITIDVEGYKKALHDVMKEKLAEAAFQYLDAVLAKVPVWSGASAATFLQLAKTISFPLNINPISQLGLGIAFGEAHGTGTFDDNASNTGLYFFTYATTLAHLVWNEQFAPPGPGQTGELKHPGPYNFRAAGQAAFEKVAKTARLPSPFESLKFRRITVK